MPFLDPIRPLPFPALLFLLVLPLYPFVRKHHTRLFFTTFSLVMLSLTAGPLLAGGLVVCILAAYFPIEWAARQRRHCRLMLVTGVVVLHAAYWSAFFLPLPSAFRHLRPQDAPGVFVLLSGIGLSFFRMLSHFADRMTGRTEPTSLRDYVTYMLFFPQFRHGPIERSRSFIPKLVDARRNWSPRDAAAGLARIGLGILAFAVLAGIAAIVPYLPAPLRPTDEINPFVEPERLSTLQLAILVHALPLVLYAIASGAASIQLGVSRTFAVRGTENFRYPLISSSPQELWQRWNITLSHWLRDYVYRPLGGKRRQTLNVVLVFVYCGLLHAPQWRTVVWGLFTGGSLVLYGWVAGYLRLRRRARVKADGLRGEPHRKVPVALRRFAKLLAIAVTYEWACIAVVILADPDTCGARVLGEVLKRILAGLGAS